MGQCCVACCVECITGQKLEDLKNASNGTVGDTRRDAQGNFIVPDHIHLRVFGDFAQKYADVWHTNTDGAEDVHTALRVAMQIDDSIRIEVFRDDDLNESEAKIPEGTTWADNNLKEKNYWSVTGGFIMHCEQPVTLPKPSQCC